MRKHTGDRPWPCAHCSFAAQTKWHLGRHAESHVGSAPPAIPEAAEAAEPEEVQAEWVAKALETVGDWSSHRYDDGGEGDGLYYYNKETKVSSYERPSSFPALPAVAEESSPK